MDSTRPNKMKRAMEETRRERVIREVHVELDDDEDVDSADCVVK